MISLLFASPRSSPAHRDSIYELVVIVPFRGLVRLNASRSVLVLTRGPGPKSPSDPPIFTPSTSQFLVSWASSLSLSVGRSLCLLSHASCKASPVARCHCRLVTY